MKFAKKFFKFESDHQDYDGQNVSVKRLKKMLKCCPDEDCEDWAKNFFQQLMENAETVLSYFTGNAQRLITKHERFSSGWPVLNILKSRIQVGDSIAADAASLLAYATMNHLALRKLIKKFEKCFGKSLGNEYKAKVIEIDRKLAHSPLLIELVSIANLLGHPIRTPDLKLPLSDSADSVVSEGEEEKLSNECDVTELCERILFGVRLEVDSTCCVCMDVLHEPVALTCGHIFCKACACESAGIPLDFALGSAPDDAKCPFCRQSGVFKGAIVLKELNSNLKSKNPSLWRSREKEIRKNLNARRSEYRRKMTAEMQAWSLVHAAIEEEMRRRAAQE